MSSSFSPSSSNSSGLDVSNKCGGEVVQVMDLQRRRRRRQPCEQLRCPRCDSFNTKFCYYNNYNKSQPRHLCKACKRHWTEGGALRTVPVGGGGGAGKNRRPKSAVSGRAPAISAMEIDDLQLEVQRSSYLHGELQWAMNMGVQRSMESDLSSSSSYVQSEVLEESTMADQWPLEDACCWALEEIEALVSTDLSPLWDDDFGESKP